MEKLILESYPPGTVTEQTAFVGAVKELPTIGVKGGHASQATTQGKMIMPTIEDFHKKLFNAALNENEKSRVAELLNEYKDVFYVAGEIPPVIGVDFQVKYNGPHIKCHPIRLSKEHTKKMNQLVDDQVASGLLEEVSDPNELHYVSPAFLKQEENKYRLLVSYVKINEHVLRSTFEFEDCSHILARLAKGLSWNSFDAKSGYTAIVVSDGSRQYLVFVIYDRNGRPRYLKPTRMPMGSSNAVEVYSYFINQTYGAIPNVECYLDDINQANGADFGENLENLEKVLHQSRQVKIVFNFSKLELFQPTLKILGEIISADGRQPDPDRIAALRDFEIPTTKKALQSFLGMYVHISKSLPRASDENTRYLHTLTKGTANRIPITERYEQAFEAVKLKACKWIMLAPFDPNKRIIVQTDSSGFGLGGVLLQYDEIRQMNRVVLVFSKKWPEVAANWKLWH